MADLSELVLRVTGSSTVDITAFTLMCAYNSKHKCEHSIIKVNKKLDLHTSTYEVICNDEVILGNL
jgi:hypothetical protein